MQTHVKYDAGGSMYKFYTADGYDEETDNYVGEYDVDGMTYPEAKNFSEATADFMRAHGVSRAHAEQAVGGVEIDRLCKQYCVDHRVNYDEALSAILSDPRNAKLATAWARPSGMADV